MEQGQLLSTSEDSIAGAWRPGAPPEAIAPAIGAPLAPRARPATGAMQAKSTVAMLDLECRFVDFCPIHSSADWIRFLPCGQTIEDEFCRFVALTRGIRDGN